MELIVVVAILPLVIGAVAVALLAVFKNADSTSNALSESGDTQVVSSQFVLDVQSAYTITTSSSPTNPAPCVSSSQSAAGFTHVLSLEYPSVNRAVTVTNGSATVADTAANASDHGEPISGAGIPPNTYVGTVTPGTGYLLSSSPISQVNVLATQNGVSVTIGGQEISYVEVPQGASNRVLRNFCWSGSTIPVTTSAVAHSANTIQALVAGSPCPQTLGQGSTCPVSTSWTSAAGTAYVKLTIVAPLPNTSNTYTYSLQAAPRSSNPGSSGIPGGGSLTVLLLGSTGDDWNCAGTMTDTSGQMVMDSTSGGASNGTVTANGGFYTADTTDPSAALANTTVLPLGASLISGPPIPDPYKNLAAPSIPALSPTNGGPIGGVFEPGLYTSTLAPGNDPLASGIYYLEDGFSAGGNDSVTNQTGGVLLYIAGGGFTMGGTSQVNLSPLASPPSPVANMVIWQAASDGTTLNLHGTGSTEEINGTIYAPNASLDIKGGGNGNGFTAGALLAQQVNCNSPNGHFTVNGET